MIVLEHIKKQYGENTVLDDISLEISKGEIVSILGPSGGGKTTLLNVLLGITDITSGCILCDGEDITHVPMEKRGFKSYESIKQKIKQIVDQYQLTTVMVTHDPEEALTMSDKVLILNGGKIAQYSTPGEIFYYC